MPTASPDPDTPPFRIAVGIATRGRPAILRAAVDQIARQTRPPDRVVICCTGPDDIAGLPDGVAEIVPAPPGLASQRNVIIDRLADCDAVLFIDDDFLMAPSYVAVTAAILSAHPNIVATTGDPVADGARGPGYGVDQALALIAADPPHDPSAYAPAPHGYGCNMAIRLTTARTHAIRFDERLPLYAWSEDVDYTHRIGRHGVIAKLYGARGVHLGAKSGRTSGRRLGYSQVANPIYLYFKGSYSFGRAARSVGRNMAMNAARAVRPEPFIDRRGRLRGNALAFADILRGRLAPERILDL